MHICKFCNTHNSPNKSGLTRHEKHCYSNPNRIPQKDPWNKGLGLVEALELGIITKDTYDSILLGRIRGGKNSTGIGSTLEKEIERKRKISDQAKLKNGGYRQGSGRGKKGWYKGFFCDSSYELAYLIYCLDHNIDIKRNTEKRKYEYQGTIKNYIPDFIVQGEFVEIKGYKSDQWEAKLKSNPDIKILYGKDLKEVFEYVNKIYGKDFIRLYE